ncbi:AAA family ATPase [Nitrosomonas oligotropha]|uniref:AAA family ATPase n=1 Tax=Nitrosomonas oligotropha TaxID=42354 RepID=UPI001371C61E|nr:MoxR family ATPase [Nitrosomonas oligotropha]MXS84028.1 AAA family ATPase [Nitrosomonas oligotropha]
MSATILQKITTDIAKLEIKAPVKLPAYGSWPETVHQFDEKSIYVLKTALAARRPVLLRGDPGTGKSQLAHAAAVVLGRLFVYEVVNAHTEGQDLLWKFDAVGRLAEAQTIKDGDDKKTLLDTKRFISPGVLWWALDWQAAHDVYKDSQYQLSFPEKPPGWQQADGSVILFDEIGKANAELPNSLLEILGNNAIHLPWLKTTIGGQDSVPPLVIITTNEERELPAAFVRRCLVLNLDLPKDDSALIDFLIKRGQLHFGAYCNEDVCRKAAGLLIKDRTVAREKGITPPGQAEYLDMLRALAVLAKTPDEQLVMLDKISEFALRKYPVMHDQ